MIQDVKLPVTKPMDVQERFTYIWTNVRKNVDDEVLEELCRRDTTYNNLKVDYDKAKKKNKAMTFRIIQRQLDARRGEIEEKMMQQVLADLAVSGRIINYMPEDAQDEFDKYRGMYAFILDVADSVLKELEDVLRKNGLAGELTMDTKLKDARESISEWTRETTEARTEETEELFCEESDRILAFAEKRFDAMVKKIQRKRDKQDKDKTACPKNNDTEKPKQLRKATKKKVEESPEQKDMKRNLILSQVRRDADKFTSEWVGRINAAKTHQEAEAICTALRAEMRVKSDDEETAVMLDALLARAKMEIDKRFAKKEKQAI